MDNEQINADLMDRADVAQKNIEGYTPAQIVKHIAIYNGFSEFANAFNINENDLIITNECIYSASMEGLKLQCGVLFQERYGNSQPSNVMMDDILAEAKNRNFNRVIAVGGDMVIDAAKLLVRGGQGTTVGYFERHIPIQKKRKLVIVPATCGTGSEMTNITIMEIKEQKGIAADERYADYAVLIPELLKGLPYKVFATSSIDARVHAAESFVTPDSNRTTEFFSTKAIERILNVYKKIVADGGDQHIRLMEEFILDSAYYAGIVFSNTGIDAVHTVAYPLGGVYHILHGAANQQMFTTVFQAYKRIKPVGRIQELERQLAALLNISNVWPNFDVRLERILPSNPLQEYGMKETEIAMVADSIIENQQRLLRNNYAPFSREEMIDIYKPLY